MSKSAASNNSLRRSCREYLFALFSLLIALAPASASDVRYAIGKVQLRGGNQVAGVPHGIVFRQEFDVGCELLSKSLLPAAASLGQRVRLAVQVIACTPVNAVPELTCQWQIGESEGVSRWMGDEFEIPVDLPEVTGSQSLQLRCSAAGQPLEEIEVPLYVTYQPPLAMVDPPAESWYMRAVTWGEGLSIHVPEQEVVRKLQLAMYAFGQRFWRYGFCILPRGANHCSFQGEPPVPADDLNCCNDCSENYCKCKWPEMVLPIPTCNFSDCYVFSEVLQFISATMGIGGFRSIVYRGEYRNGFVTRATSNSLDPAFTGNLLCGERNLPCNYLFDNHSLRRRHHVIFDATFGEVYRDASEAASASVLCPHGDDFVYSSRLWGTRLAEQIRIGYGQFPIYEESRRPSPICEAGTTQDFDDPFVQLPYDHSSRGAFWLDDTRAIGVNPDADGRFRALRIEATLEVPVRRLTTIVATLSSAHRSIAYASTRLNAKLGANEVVLIVPGSQIAEAGIDGEYYVTLNAYRGSPVELSASTYEAIGRFSTSDFN